jgi:hypothetical protein
VAGWYEGKRGRKGILTDEGDLNPRWDLLGVNPLEWGHGGQGSAQTALAILAAHLGDDRAAVSLYHLFKRQVISHCAREGFRLTREDIDEWLEREEVKAILLLNEIIDLKRDA